MGVFCAESLMLELEEVRVRTGGVHGRAIGDDMVKRRAPPAVTAVDVDVEATGLDERSDRCFLSRRLPGVGEGGSDMQISSKRSYKSLTFR